MRPLLAAGVTAALVVAGCGSSSEPVAHSTFVLASVDATGTLTVNGTTFATGGAVLRDLDEGRTLTLGGDPSELRFLAGSVVAIRAVLGGDGRSGSAEEILLRSVIRGPLQGRSESSLAIGGADVLVDSRTTILDGDELPTTLDALPGGARIEVHGWPESGTRVRASLLRVLPGDPAVAVHGWTLAAPVSGAFDVSLVQGGATLLRVDASAATVPLPPPADALVRVAGSGIAAGGPPLLRATSVDVVAQILPMDEERAIVEGVVLTGTAGEFVLGDHRVRTAAATAYEDVPAGDTAGALVAPGVRVVVEGRRGGGTIVADRLRFVDVLRLAGRIDPGSFAIGNPATFGSFTLTGEIVSVGATTRFTSGGVEITLPELVELHAAEAAGLAVVVHGYRRADGTVEAQRITVTSG